MPQRKKQIFFTIYFRFVYLKVRPPRFFFHISFFLLYFPNFLLYIWNTSLTDRKLKQIHNQNIWTRLGHREPTLQCSVIEYHSKDSFVLVLFTWSWLIQGWGKYAFTITYLCVGHLQIQMNKYLNSMIKKKCGIRNCYLYK